MTDHKFTNEEVIKALECCAEGDSCFGICPYDDGDDECTYCTSKLARDALDLINRQKEEIEHFVDINKMHSEIRAEGIKEFAERLKAGLIEGGIYPAFVKKQIEKIVKEMTEENAHEG